jgi:hypothetical protein
MTIAPAVGTVDAFRACRHPIQHVRLGGDLRQFNWCQQIERAQQVTRNSRLATFANTQRWPLHPEKSQLQLESAALPPRLDERSWITIW